MRQLDKNERVFTEKNIANRKVELAHIKLLVEYNTFMLDKMLFSNYLEKRRGYEKQTKDFINEVEEMENIIKISEEQLVKGVKIIKKIVEDVPEMVN